MAQATAVHPNSALTPTGRAQMVDRHLIDGAPIAHVAREFRVSWGLFPVERGGVVSQGARALA